MNEPFRTTRNAAERCGSNDLTAIFVPLTMEVGLYTIADPHRFELHGAKAAITASRSQGSGKQTAKIVVRR